MLCGIVPGAGATIASFVAYGIEGQYGKRRGQLGSGIPEGIVEKLNREIARIVSSPAMREKLVAQHFVPSPSTAGEFAVVLKNDIARWTRLIRQVGIRVD